VIERAPWLSCSRPPRHVLDQKRVGSWASHSAACALLCQRKLIVGSERLHMPIVGFTSRNVDSGCLEESPGLPGMAPGCGSRFVISRIHEAGSDQIGGPRPFRRPPPPN